MAANFREITNLLITRHPIDTDAELVSLVKTIDKLARTNAEHAWLLGHLFKFKLDSDHLQSEVKRQLIRTIKKQHLQEYFYLKSTPEVQESSPLLYIFFWGGMAAIIIGIYQLSNDIVTVGQNLRYLQPVVKNGGFKILLGLILVVATSLHGRRQKKIRNFVKEHLSN